MDSNLKVTHSVCVVVYWLTRIQGVVRLNSAAESVVLQRVRTIGVIPDDDV